MCFHSEWNKKYFLLIYFAKFPVYYLFLVKNDKLLWEIELLMVGTCLVILVGLLILEKPLPLFTGHPNWFVPSLRSKHFRGVGEQRKT